MSHPEKVIMREGLGRWRNAVEIVKSDVRDKAVTAPLLISGLL